MKSAFLCADIGTSSLKAALIDRKNGHVLGYNRQYFSFASNASSLLDASLWVEAFERAASKLTASKNACVEAMCISGNGPTLVSSEGDLLLWNAPTPDFTPPPLRSLFIPRLLYFRDRFPERWQAARWILSGPEYLVYCLTSEALTTLPEARYTAAYWERSELEQCRIEAEKLPPFAPPERAGGRLLPYWSERLGLSSGIPVFSGGPDFITALVGTDTLSPGAVCDRAGSSEGINVCVPHFFTRDEVRTLPAVVPGLFNAGFLIPDSSLRFSEYRLRRGGGLSYTELVKEILAQGKGEGYDIISSLAWEVRRGLRILSDLLSEQGLPPISRVKTTGGQAHNADWVQFKSRIAGLPFEVPSCPDAELIGCAVFAGLGLGDYASLREGAAALSHTSRVFEP